jgi:hypothetical protein
MSHVDLPSEGMPVMHSVALSACQGVAYIADREAGRVHSVPLATWDKQPEVYVDRLDHVRLELKAVRPPLLIASW